MSFLRLTTATLAACTLLTAAPAWAAVPPEEENYDDLGIVTQPAPAYQLQMGQRADLKSPALAAGLSILGPVTMGVASLVVGNLPSTDRVRINGMSPSTFGGVVLVGSSPLGLGFGHAYAGDPWRGLAVGLCAPLVVLSGGFGGFIVDLAVRQGSGYGSAGLVLGMGAAAVGYSIWAASDAYGTAERKNEEALRR